jgi:PAS domain S-box-containing protein
MKDAEAARAAILKSSVGVTGQTCLDMIVENMAGWLDVDCAIIGEIISGGREIMGRSMWLDGKIVDALAFKLEDIPCSRVADEGFCLYPEGVGALFPDAKYISFLNIEAYAGTQIVRSDGSCFGVLCLLSRRPLTKIKHDFREIMDILAARASAELERMQAEDALAKSEERFRLLADSTFEGIIIHDNGDILDCNNAMMTMFGYGNDEAHEIIVKRHVIDFIDPASRELFLHAMQTDYEKPYVLIMLKKDGSPITVEIAGQPEAIIYKEKKAKVLVLRDITEYKQAEEALLKSEQKYRSIFENAIEGIFQTSPEGRFISINPALARIFGFTSPEEMITGITDIGKQLYTSAEDRTRHTVMLKNQEEVNDFETAFYKKDGSKIWVLINARAVKDKTGKLLFFEGTVEDISERKRADEALQKSNDRYKELADLLPQMVFEVNENSFFTFVNRYTLVHFGYTQDDIDSGLKLFQVLSPQDRDRIKAAAERISKGEPLEGIEFTALKKDGTNFPILTYLSPVKKGKKFAGLRGIAIDITERKQLEEQLFHAQKMESIGTLAGGIAHDFNNLLTTILGSAQLLLMKANVDTQVKVYLNRIIEAGESAAQLTQNLLTFSRKQIMKPVPLDINKIVEKIGKMVLRTIGENIESDTRLKDAELKTVADAGQIEQVLMNLIVNARDAMPEGGKLTIETDFIKLDEEFTSLYVGGGKPGKYIRITVADTGTGMDKRTTERMFEPFFTTKDVGKGTGLGLSIVFGIIKKHNGYINVSSETDKGTAISVYLPVIDPVLLEKKTDIQDMLFEEGYETILLAEDNEMTRNTVRSILEEGGYEVVEAVDGEDAIQRIIHYKGNFDMIILDVMMPRKNIKEVYNEIKKMNPFQKILFMSGYPRGIIDRSGVIDEKLNFIEKPLMPAQLLAKVREILDS